jgi:hypothetical protein
MNWNELLACSMSYEEYLSTYGTPIDREKWQRSLDATELSASQSEVLGTFRRRMTLLCMAGAWCGDCVEHVPILRLFEQRCAQIQLRLIDRDQHDGLKEYLTICGSPRVPQTVVLSEDGLFVDRWGDRPLAKYRDLAARLSGAACSSGLIIPGDPLRMAIIANWFEELERCQYILRTSPSLRKRHND